MKVTLDPEARSFIETRGGHLILFQGQATGCCGIGSAYVPMVEVGRPRKSPETYLTWAQDGVTIHVDRTLEGTPGPFRVQLTSLFGWRSVTLVVEGGPSS